MTRTEQADALKPVDALEVLREIVAHLKVAVVQSVPTDDQIIMDHVRAALDLASMLRSAQR